MQAAGLNPMLAYSQGGAQSAGSSQAVMQPELSAQTMQSSAQAVMGILQGIQQIKTGEWNNIQTEAMVDKIRSETMDREMNTAQQAANIAQTTASEKNLKELASRTSEEVLGARYDSSAKQMKYRAEKNDQELKGTGWEADVRRRKAEASLSELDIPRSKNMADWEKRMGETNPALNTLMNVLRGVSTARGAMR